MTKNVEEYVGDLNEKIGSLTQEMDGLKKVLQKELALKDVLISSRSIERVKSETALTALYVTLDEWNKWTRTFTQLIQENQEQKVQSAAMHATLTPMLKTTEELRAKVMELIPMDRRDIAIAELNKLMEQLKRLERPLPPPAEIKIEKPEKPTE